VTRLEQLLPPATRSALDRARKKNGSYAVRLLRCPDTDRTRILVLLGEAHLKFDEAWTIGERVVDCFELRGVEGFMASRVIARRLASLLINGPRLLLRVLLLGSLKGSTIVYARARPTGDTYPLERDAEVPLSLHVAVLYLVAFFGTAFFGVAVDLVAPLREPLAPIVAGNDALRTFFGLHVLLVLPAFLLRRLRWAWLVHPGIGILTDRNRTMAYGTVRMLQEHPEAEVALVIMGRAHLAGYAEELVEKYGFTRDEEP
jgi:hypothetical protein